MKSIIYTKIKEKLSQFKLRLNDPNMVVPKVLVLSLGNSANNVIDKPIINKLKGVTTLSLYNEFFSLFVLKEKLINSDMVFMVVDFADSWVSDLIPLLEQALNKMNILGIYIISENAIFEKGLNFPILSINKNINLTEQLTQSINCVHSITCQEGLFKTDLKDIKNTLSGSSFVYFDHGAASGENRVIEATRLAICNSENTAKINNAIYHVSGGSDFSLVELMEGVDFLGEKMNDENGNIICGVYKSNIFKDKVEVALLISLK